MKITKPLKLTKIAQSKGFIIPIQYTKERVADGLEHGKKYLLEITEASDGLLQTTNESVQPDE